MDQAKKAALIKDLDQQRSDLSARYRGLRGELDLAYQLRLSVKRHPKRWAAAAAGITFLGMRLLRSKKVIYKDQQKNRSLLFRTGKLVFNLARPALTTMALNYARKYAEAHLHREQENSMLGGPPQK
ncbi:MAG: hypothetical protein P8M04_04125 [Akkermansiaceae bacterium]|nr:hypothetical protein [Akkermansiaceae bacterium]